MSKNSFKHYMISIMNIKQIVKSASLFTLILAFMMIGMIAIAEVMKKQDPVEVERVVVLETWHYNGGSTDSPTDPTKYTRSAGEPCGGINQTICKILAPAQSSNPDLPDMNAEVETDDLVLPTVAEQINQALSTPTPATNETVQSFRSF